MPVHIHDLFHPKTILPHIVPCARAKLDVHGVAHWTRVHRFGLLLAESLQLSELEKSVIALFAWTHDLARTTDHADPQHANNGADYLLQITRKLLPDYPEEALQLTQMAIRYHSSGLNVEEALHEYRLLEKTRLSRETILNVLGCCWDADRLDLLRLGIVPRDEKMSTPYWQDILPLAARLNKATHLVTIHDATDTNEDDWFIQF